MTRDPLQMLQSATNAVTSPVADLLHGFARNCTDLHGQNARMRKTNTPSAAPVSGNGKGLAPRVLRAIELLLAGHSIVGTARILGVNESTVRRWRMNPEFRDEADRRSREQDAATARSQPTTAYTAPPMSSRELMPEELDPQYREFYQQLRTGAHELLTRHHAGVPGSARNCTDLYGSARAKTVRRRKTNIRRESRPTEPGATTMTNRE